jgi:hypothetical protein
MADGLAPNKKLVWLGFKNPQQDVNQAGTDIQKLKDNVGDWSTFQGHLDAYDLDGDGTDEDISGYTQFQTYLEDNGFTTLEAQAFIDKIKNAWSDEDSSGSSYDEFEDWVENTGTSYQEFQSQFSTAAGMTGEEETSEGEKVTGIIFHDEAGVSKDGVNLPPGTTEIFGNRIEFSKSEDIETGEPLMSYSNLQIDNQTPNKYETITITCDLQNIGDVSGDAFPQLKVDGEVVKAQGPIFLLNGESTTVTFTYSFSELVSVDVTIADLEPLTVSVIPEGLLI